jgi:hypothetical protein
LNLAGADNLGQFSSISLSGFMVGRFHEDNRASFVVIQREPDRTSVGVADQTAVLAFEIS